MDIKELLNTVDKYLFIMFRNKEITLDQLKARVAEKYQGIKYVCLDDLRSSLDPEIIKGMEEEMFFKLYKSVIVDGRRIVPVEEF
jgi:hypothetical protein